MQIAHILRKYNPVEWGGTETALHRLFASLHPRGIRSTDSDPLAQAGNRIRRYKAFAPVSGMTDEQRAQLISVGGNLMSFDLPWLLWREPDLHVIHSHALGRLGGIALTVAKRRSLPFVVSVHGGVLAIPDSLRQSFQAPGRGWEW